MFGYVRPYRPELRVREDEYYKGTYCGLCKAMGRCTGQCSRLSLNYDLVTFALIRFALAGEETAFSQEKCLLHPFKKRSVMNGNVQLEYTSCVSSLLSYHKIKDDIADEGAFRRMLAGAFLLPAVSSMKRRAVKRACGVAELDEVCRQKLVSLSNFEADDTAEPSVDIPAGMFGELLGELMAHGFEGAERKIAYSAGFHLGKWIYVADALDDARDDMEKGRYNPFLRLYGGMPGEEQLGGIELALKNELYGLEAALDLIDYGKNVAAKELINNVIYLGMPKKIESIIEKYSSKI